MTAVKTYALTWDIDANSGTVFLVLTNGHQGHVRVDSAAELAALGDILRNSHNVGFDEQAQTLSTQPTAPGTA